jgi:hypothetical protein
VSENELLNRRIHAVDCSDPLKRVKYT